MKEKIEKLTKDNHNNLIEIRRYLHSHPEDGFLEYLTSQKVIEELNKLKVFDIKKSAITGVVAIIKGNKSSDEPLKCIGIRADMDGLQIQDLKDVSYKSKHIGFAHACGHDAHTTILLGVAHNLVKLQDSFSGYVKLFFQPAEETDGGALPMIKEGYMENPHVDVMIGLHVNENYEVGHIRFCYDTMQASSAEIKIIINGKGAHAAHPENGVDGILVASKIIDSLHTIVSRYIAPLNSAAVNIGKINGGSALNSLAEVVTMEGTIRTLTEETMDYISRLLKQMCNGIASGFGATAEVIIVPTYPPLINNKQIVDFISKVAEEIYPLGHIHKDSIPSLGVEDFAYFAKAVPSCYYNIGVANKEKGIIYPGHNGHFDIDEESLYHGTVIQTLSVLKLLNRE